MSSIIRLGTVRKAGRLLPRRAVGLRGGVVVLKPGGIMDWHSTKTREELIIFLEGRAQVEIQSRSQRRGRRIAMSGGKYAFLPRRTLHRVVNRSNVNARYIYVTGVLVT